jgi:uncharacterized membrane protein YhaH (DUF805 family)
MAVEKSPVEWALTPLRKYAQFSGRAPRAEYWWFYLFYIIAYVAASIIDGILGTFGILIIFVALGLVIPVLAVGVRRLHDIDRTGWWLLAPILPYALGVAMMFPAILSGAADPANPFSMAGLGLVGILFLIGFALAIVLFIFTLLPGTKGDNRYGPDPYGEQENLEAVFS